MGQVGPTSSSCSSWDALVTRGTANTAPPGGGSGRLGTPRSSATRTGAHATGSRVPRAPPGGRGGCDLQKRPGSPSSDRVSEPEDDSAEEAPSEDTAAAGETRVGAPWPLHPRGTGSGASETSSPMSLSVPKCRPEGWRGTWRLPGKPGLLGCVWIALRLPGCGERRRRLHDRGQGAEARRQVHDRRGSAADRDSRAQGHASRDQCSARRPAARTAVSLAKPASGTKRRRRAARRANGSAGALVGGGCGAAGRAGVR